MIYKIKSCFQMLSWCSQYFSDALRKTVLLTAPFFNRQTHRCYFKQSTVRQDLFNIGIIIRRHLFPSPFQSLSPKVTHKSDPLIYPVGRVKRSRPTSVYTEACDSQHYNKRSRAQNGTVHLCLAVVFFEKSQFSVYASSSKLLIFFSICISSNL